MNKKGFSLIELLIVIVIIGIIAIIAVPSLLESKKAAQHTATIAMLRNVGSACVAYSSKIGNNGIYPNSFASLVGQNFLDSRFNAGTAIDGFTYGMTGQTGVFTVVATGQPPNDGYSYYINHTLVVYDKTGNPVNAN